MSAMENFVQFQPTFVKPSNLSVRPEVSAAWRAPEIAGTLPPTRSCPPGGGRQLQRLTWWAKAYIISDYRPL